MRNLEEFPHHCHNIVLRIFKFYRPIYSLQYNEHYQPQYFARFRPLLGKNTFESFKHTNKCLKFTYEYSVNSSTIQNGNSLFFGYFI